MSRESQTRESGVNERQPHRDGCITKFNRTAVNDEGHKRKRTRMWVEVDEVLVAQHCA